MAKQIKNITEAQLEELIVKGWSMEPTEDDNQVVLTKGKKTETYTVEWSTEKPKQVHISRDRDIKLESKKVGEVGVKIIYHRMKDDTKQYRIFLATKSPEGKLTRTRLKTTELQKVERDEQKALEYFHSITKSVESLKKVM